MNASETLAPGVGGVGIGLHVNCLHSGFETCFQRGQGTQLSHLQGSVFAASLGARELRSSWGVGLGTKSPTQIQSATLASPGLLMALPL